MMDVLPRLRGIFLLLTSVVVVSLTSALAASDRGQAAADEVSEASYRGFLGDNQGAQGILYTHNGDDRGYGPEHDLARANIVAAFEGFGLSVTLEPFAYSGTYYNIVATKTGTAHPFQEWIVGAHFDSTSYSGAAPGADDDASGVATLLETARIISQYDADYTIRFICFDREEQGLIGSYAYVDSHFGDSILGMVQCDMMAWDPATNNASIWGDDNPALPLKNALSQAISLYSFYQGAPLTPIDRGWNGQSDHAPFDYAGFQACMFIEGEGFNNNTIHTSNDSVDNPGYINYPYAVRMTKSIVGWLVDAAGVQVSVDTLNFAYPNGRPEFVAPAGGDTTRVEVTGVGNDTPEPGTGVLHYNTGIAWESSPMIMVSPNVYDALFPATECGNVVLYYVSAEAVGGAVFTDPRQAPSATYSAQAAYGRTILFEDDFEINQGWTPSGNASAGLWQRGVPVGCSRGDPASDFDGSGRCYLTENDAIDCNSDIDGGYTYLVSPTLNLSDGDADIAYALWYTNNYGADPNNDVFKTYVSNNNGASWILVETVGPATPGGWSVHEFRVSDFVTPTGQVKVQFEASDLGSGSVVEAGIDAFSISRLLCCGGADGDMNGDQAVNGLDIEDFADAMINGPTPDQECHGDFDGINGLDIGDIPGMVDALLTS